MKNIKVEFIKTNHSIAGTSSLAITTPAGVIFHTGDFKVDYTPLFGDTINLQRIAEIGSQGVLAVLSDSTNAMRPGFTPSERLVAKTFENLFAESTSSRIIVATYASNIDRVQHAIHLCGFKDLDEFSEFIDSMLLLKADITPTPEEIEAYAEEFAQQKHRFKRHPEPAGKAEVLLIYTNSLLKKKH